MHWLRWREDRIFQPASCVISIVVWSHRTCFERTTDEWGWQRERTDFDFGPGCFFKETKPGNAPMEHSIWNPHVLLLSFSVWNSCFLQKVSCELVYFKNCNLWGERVFFDNITSWKPLGVESSLFLGSSMLFLVVLRIALCLDSTESHLNKNPVTAPQWEWNVFLISRFRACFLEFCLPSILPL